MNLDDFYSKIRAARLRASKLYVRVSQSLVQQQELLMESFEELNVALKNLKVAEEELHQQQEALTTARELAELERQRYQDLFELISNAYLVTDRRGIIQEANRAAATLFNVPQRFLVDKPLAGFVSREGRRVFLSELNKLHECSQRQEWEMRLQPRNSDPIDATVTVTPANDREGRRLALSWLVCDISKPKQASESELLGLQRALQQVTTPILITTAELNEPGPKIVFVNQAFTQATGYSVEEITDKTPRILQGSKTARAVLKQLRRQLSQGKPFQGETINYCKDGTEYKVQMHCSPIQNDRGEITHFLSIQCHIPLEKAVS